jgi:hypothetical protein
MLRPTVSRPVYLGVKHPFWDLRPDFFFCLTVAGLLIWGALSDKRTGLSFIMYNILKFKCYYMNIYTQYKKGFCQSRLSTADHVLSLVAPAYEF